MNELKPVAHASSADRAQSTETLKDVNKTTTDATESTDNPGGFVPTFHWRILGTPAPVFPGFELDICDRIPQGKEPDAVWHRNRARSILRDHPEVRSLFGRTSITAVFCVAVVAVQISIAIAMHSQPWWVVVLTAYLVGGLTNLALFNLAHECNHALVFKNRLANILLYTLTTMPMLFPGHHTWWIEHHVHHNHMGSTKDFIKRRRSTLLALKDRVFGYVPKPPVRQMTTWITTPLFWPISAFMIITQILRSAFGLIVYAVSAIARGKLAPSDFALSVLADQHLVSGYHRYKLEWWAVVYPLTSVGMILGLYFAYGWGPLSYLFFSALFCTGFLHPLIFGLVLSNSHFHGHKCYQPSSSYYGPVNWLTFNIGLHTEHHDFHYIPWFRLPQVRKMAPEYYEDLLQTKSFAWLALKFAFGSREAFNSEEHRNVELLQEQGRKSSVRAS